MYRQLIKPLLDKLIALIGFIILSPLFVLATILLFVANNGKPFFLQPRPGKGGRIFRIIKFKTMNDAKDTNGELLPDAKRLTLVGSIVRKTSIDEIPQLLNVLIGNMSLIGPRPLLAEYLPLYNERQRRRHEVKPGITGWAQVNGRNSISWEEKFELDVYYVNNMSLLLDVKILLMTVVNVFRGKGISQEGAATMEKFKGTPKQAV
ncbi:lipid carrier--UDP-N-acetylgalactosaminyltransferase [Chitinophagaceae bacterium IBVUCB1]|nr:lipid carrier--UDP-N-acetylgalactosaminyltransferase [Chitinophagaceae bacterium IBVUCB1]